MRRVIWSLAACSLVFSSVSAWGQNNPCDLTGDGVVDASDVQAAINMTLGLVPCTVNIVGANTCNVVVVQRIVNASLGGACFTGNGHNVTLKWNASASTNIASYSVYRGTASGGPYSLLSTSVVPTSFTDNSVQPGATYFYVTTAVDANNNESTYSNEVRAAIPAP